MAAFCGLPLTSELVNVEADNGISPSAPVQSFNSTHLSDLLTLSSIITPVQATGGTGIGVAT